VLVEGVVPYSPADKAHLKVGDRILAFDGTPVHSSDEMTSLVRVLKPGDEIEMTVSRGADIFPVHATLEGALRAPVLPRPDERGEEIRRLKSSLEKLDTERKQTEDRIKALEGTPQR
jgi:predicted metalloprotease with PDZ domain